MIYCVEDDLSIRELMLYTLRASGFEALGFENGEQLFDAISTSLPRLILLDIMLPGMNGIEILKKIRENPATASVPVILASARGTEYDKVLGLDTGADDYLAKPFGMMEMVSRVRALLRRAGRSATGEKNEVLSLGPLTLWPKRREVTLEGAEMTLTQREFDLLEFLMRYPGEVFSREELLQRVWGWDFDGGSRTVDVHVQQLRAKLGDHADLIETVRGVGYRARG